MALKQIKFFNLSLPVDRDRSNKYFKLNINIIDAIKDDLKVLLLTNKNERVMNPDFGIGFERLERTARRTICFTNK
jgi:phage baseplate assembly protein W